MRAHREAKRLRRIRRVEKLACVMAHVDMEIIRRELLTCSSKVRECHERRSWKGGDMGRLGGDMGRLSGCVPMAPTSWARSNASTYSAASPNYAGRAVTSVTCVDGGRMWEEGRYEMGKGVGRWNGWRWVEMGGDGWRWVEMACTCSMS